MPIEDVKPIEDIKPIEPKIIGTISRIDKTGENQVSVCVEFNTQIPSQKFYTFDINEEITLETIKSKVTPDLQQANSFEEKFKQLQTLINQTI